MKASFTEDRHGVTSVFFAVTAVALLTMLGLVIDIGNIHYTRRSLQGAADLAAISAATNISNAAAAANANAVANGFTAADVASVALGSYTANPAVAAASRFRVTSLGAANAVQVSMSHQQPLFFSGLYALAGGSNGVTQNGKTITAQGLAISQILADFGIGSRVASYNGGVVNGVLGGAVGGSVNLSAADYNSLASANVDLFGLANAVAAQAGQVGGSYSQAFAGTVSLASFLTAVINVAPTASSALQQLETAAASSGVTVDLSRLLNYGPYANLAVSSPEPNVTATASALSLVQAAMQLGGASHLVTLSNLAVNIPGISSVSGTMTFGEPPVGTTVTAINQVGNSVSTSQLRLMLTISLVGTAPATVVTLPLYIQLGYATASLQSLTCNPLTASTTVATLNVTPGLVNGWIGTVSTTQMKNFSTQPTVSPAQLVNLGLTTVTGSANATVGNTAAVPVAFSYTDIQNKTIHSTSTTDFAGSLLTNLIANTTLTVGGVAVPGLPALVSSILTAAIPAVDTVLTDVLQTAGANLGDADTWVDGARCGAALLSG